MSYDPMDDVPCCDRGEYAPHCAVCDRCGACCNCAWMIRYLCDWEKEDGAICGKQFAVRAEWDDGMLEPAIHVHCPSCDYDDPQRLGEEIDELAAA